METPRNGHQHMTEFAPGSEPDRTVMVALAQLWVMFGVKHGLDPLQLCAAVGVDPSELVDRDHVMPHAAYARLRNQVIAGLPQLDVGLELGRFGNPDQFGYLGLAAKSCRNALDFMHLMSRAVGLLDSVRRTYPPEMRVGPHVVELIVPALPVSWRDPPECIESSASSQVHILQGLLGAPFTPVGVGFAHQRGPAEQRRFSEFFGCEVEFGCSAHWMSFDRALVEQPWPNADETAHRHFSAQLDRLLAGLPAPFVSMVASKLQRNLAHGAVSQAALARELGMSTRGLQRKLNASGCTFQSVLSEVRRSSALRLLSDRSIAVYEVALSLGYDDVRSFNRAFIRWTGQTPSAHRERSWGSSGAESPATMSEPDA